MVPLIPVKIPICARILKPMLVNFRFAHDSGRSVDGSH